VYPSDPAFARMGGVPEGTEKSRKAYESNVKTASRVFGVKRV